MIRWLAVILLIAVSAASGVVAQDSDSAPDYFAEVVVDNTTPYVGQQLTYQFRFYDAVALTDAQYEAPDFEGFWRVTKPALVTAARQINNRQYTMTALETALYPTRPGIIEIMPATVLLPATVFRSEERLSANPVIVNVRPLPDGAPSDFMGAVGQFGLSATLDRQSANLGESFTLRLTVTGTGNVEQLSLPLLPTPDGWRVYSNPAEFTFEADQGLIVGTKTYEYSLFPDVSGAHTLPSVTLHFFDPDAAIYRFVSTQPVTIEVLPPVTRTETASQPSIDPLLPLKPIAVVQRGSMLLPGTAFWLLWLLPPFAVGLSWWWVRRQRRQQLKAGAGRRNAALANAQHNLRRLPSQPSPAAYRRLRTIILAYFADKLNRDRENLALADIQPLLEQDNVPEPLRKRIEMCIEWADEAQYGPVTSVELPVLVHRTAETLTVMDEVWKPT